MVAGRLLLFEGLLLHACDPQGGQRGDGGEQHQQAEHGGHEGGEPGVAPAPTPEPSDRPERPRLDRLATEPSAQVVGQIAGHGIAPRRLLGHRLQADGLQVPRDPVVEPTGRARLVVADLLDHHVRRAAERDLAREAFVERHAQAIDIATSVQLESPRLFRTHVRRGAGQHVFAREALVAGLVARQAEVHQLGPPGRRVDHDVVRLDVAMHQSRGMRRGQSIGDLGGQARRLTRLQAGPGLDQVAQRRAIEVFHHQVGEALGWVHHRVHGHQVIVTEPRRGGASRTNRRRARG